MAKTFICLFVLTSMAFAKPLPEANQRVVDYVKSVMGTQVGVGECTDLIMMAQFKIRGIQSKQKKKTGNVLPGDFIRFDDVQVGGLSFANHVAIIMEVEAPNIFIIAHQNHNGNKTVHVLRVDLNNKTQGKFYTSRPR